MLGRDVSQLSDDQLRNLVAELERRFRDEALTSAAQAATIVLDGVKADRWRILVGPDAHKIDEMERRPVRGSRQFGVLEREALGPPRRAGEFIEERDVGGARAPARERRPEIKDRGRPTRSSGGRSTG